MTDYPDDRHFKRPLRVGLLVGSLRQPRWAYKAIELVQRSPYANIVLVVTLDHRPGERPSAIGNKWGHLVYRVYDLLDNYLFPTNPDLFESVNIESLVKDCTILTVRPTARGELFQEEEIESIRDCALDVAWRLGFPELKGRALHLAKFGTWSLHHGDDPARQEGPPGFWELMKGVPVTGSVLTIDGEEPNDRRVIYRSYAATNHLSARLNRNNYYSKTATFLARKLRDLHDRGPAALERDMDIAASSLYGNHLRGQPSNAQMIRMMTRTLLQYAGRKAMQQLQREQWVLTYHLGNDSTDGHEALSDFKYVLPPRDRFWADPFPIRESHRYYVFFEEFLYGEDKGHISVMEIDDSGVCGSPYKVLERDCHLSYPFVFRWKDSYFMIPESSRDGTIRLYRCTSFPGEWEPESVLLEDVTAVDTTLAQIDDRWWMFTNIPVEGAPNTDELHLFYADSPLGPWQPHRRNPVKSDVRSARPAGRLYQRKGVFYRPSQDCSSRYGYAIAINSIERINSEEFVEREVSRVEPTWDKKVVGIHTLNRAPGLTIGDCLYRRWKLWD